MNYKSWFKKKFVSVWYN